MWHGLSPKVDESASECRFDPLAIFSIEDAGSVPQGHPGAVYDGVNVVIAASEHPHAQGKVAELIDGAFQCSPTGSHRQRGLLAIGSSPSRQVRTV